MSRLNQPGRDRTSEFSCESVEVVGLAPRLFGPMARSPWWSKPIPAETFAILRILVATVLLLDQCCTMLPQLSRLYGTGSTGDPQLFEWFFRRPNLHWSLLQGIGEAQALKLAMGVWISATVALLMGWNTRLSAVLVWALAISFTNLNLYAINAGDHIRGILLFYLMLTPCGVVWSVDASMSPASGRSVRRLVHPWALRLILIQFAFMYCTSGLCKLSGQSWPNGESLYYVMNDLSLTRFSAQQVPLPYWLMQWSTWAVLFWETLFPLFVIFRRTRIPALLFGMAMHVNIFITMDLGCFPLYVLAAYAPLFWSTWSHSATIRPGLEERGSDSTDYVSPEVPDSRTRHHLVSCLSRPPSQHRD